MLYSMNKNYENRLEQVLNHEAEASHLPEVAQVIAMYISRYEPADVDVADSVNVTSYEIMEALEDICQVTTREVGIVMAFLGFRLRFYELFSPEWVMQPRNGTERNGTERNGTERNLAETV